MDSFEGSVFESKAANIDGATTFTAPQTTGTYGYTKTGTNTGRLTYVSTYSIPGASEVENGTVNLTFTSATGGTFTSSGSYSGSDFDGPYSGTFSNGTGTFTYAPGNPAPSLVYIQKNASHRQTSASGPALSGYTYESALEELTAPYATAPTLGLPTGASPASRVFVYDSVDEKYRVQVDFTNGATTAKQQLDAAFPNGNHTLSIGANSLTLTLTADAYPSVPTITSSAGKWIAGKLVFTTAEAAAGFTLTGSSTSANGYRTLEIYDDNDEVDYYEVDNANGTTPASPITRNIPGGLLKVGGPYYCEVQYDQVVDTDSTKTSEFGTGYAMFSTSTVIEIMVIQEPKDLVGTWTTATLGGGQAYITFLDNGTYHHVETGTADASGQSGLEVGTYAWNTATGALSTTPSVDQNGQWGLSHNAPDIKLFVNGDTLEIVEGIDLVKLGRPAKGAAIVGSWVFISEGRTAVITFLADGTYRHSEAGATSGGGFSGMESGSYTWNPTTGAFSATAILDQNGEWGLSHPLAAFNIAVSGDQLTLKEGGLSFVGQRANATTALSDFLSASSLPYNQRSPGDDPDADGLSNLLELALGGDPAAPNLKKLPTVAPLNNPSTGKPHLVLSVNFDASVSGLNHVVEVSSDGVNWTSGENFTEPLSDVILGGFRSLSVRDRTPADSTSSRRFMRLRVILP